MVFAAFLHRHYREVMARRLESSACRDAVPRGGSTESILLQALFTMMGKIAKADGRVIQAEIDYVNTVMSRMGLDDHRRKLAIEYFNTGKLRSCDLSPLYPRLLKALGTDKRLALALLRVLCLLAQVKGVVNVPEQALLRQFADAVKIPRRELEQLGAELLARESQPGFVSLRADYALLNVVPGDDEQCIKKSYLRLLHRYHPDKLGPAGNSGEMESAARKMQAIRQAYERICAARK
ncbi:MAG: TerB family tellurite resistance protein [Pseudomonadales bacterium]|nr:TerB family tellurite resistance protein [Pseudomonadales bacterium]